MRRMQKLVISILRHRSLFKVSLDSELQIKIHKYTNINTNTQIHKYKYEYTNTQIHKYKYEYTNAEAV